MVPTHFRAGAAILLAAALAACSSATHGAGTSTAAASSGASSGPSPEELTAIAKARADSVRRLYTEADVRFMSGMTHHHAQAIVMARMAESHGASPAIRTLAGRIINAQQDEIATAQRWLRDRNQPVPEPSPTGMKMVMNGVEHDMLMPGMLTEAQMQQLDAARGKEFDRLFLTFMIQHHKGAVTMVKELFDTYGAGVDDVVFKFASDVNVDQTTEIARMEKMLADLLFSGGSW